MLFSYPEQLHTFQKLWMITTKAWQNWLESFSGVLIWITLISDFVRTLTLIFRSHLQLYRKYPTETDLQVLQDILNSVVPSDHFGLVKTHLGCK